MQTIAMRAKISCGVMLYIVEAASQGKVSSTSLNTDFKVVVVILPQNDCERNDSRRHPSYIEQRSDPRIRGS